MDCSHGALTERAGHDTEYASWVVARRRSLHCFHRMWIFHLSGIAPAFRADAFFIAMKNYSFVIPLICACFVNAPFAGHAQNGQIRQVASVTATFPPKPDGLTNVPTIGLPIIVVPEKLIGNLGGSETTNMAVTSIGALLIKSGRFTLTYADKPELKCQVTLSDLQIQQQGRTSKTSGGDTVNKFFSDILNNKVKIPVPAFSGQSAAIDWSKDKTEMSVRCAVTVYIVDANTQNVVAGDEGIVDRKDTTKNISMTLAGFTASTGETNEVTTNTVHFESRLIQLATYYALTQMLPQLDGQLKQRQSLHATSTETNTSAEQRLKDLKQLYDEGLISKED